MNFHDWIVPTHRNNYRAKLIKAPALSVFMVLVILANTALGTVPVRSVSAAVTTQDLLRLHNQERTNRDLNPLTYSPVLANSAQKKAQAMLDSNCWSHYCPDGKSPWDFFQDAGYVYLYAGENLAEGFYNTSDAMVAWMNSETHRENILRAEYTEIGFGIVRGEYQGVANSLIIAVHFGTPAGVANAIDDTNLPRFLAPQIITPQDGAYIGSKQVEISGTAEGAELVEIIEKSQVIATADPNEGIFTVNTEFINDGYYSISARGSYPNLSQLSSPEVRLTVDTTPDPILEPDIVVILISDTEGLIQINKQGLAQIKLKLGNTVIGLTNAGSTLWEAEVSLNEITTATSITAESTDLAGNIWAGQFDSEVVSKYLESSDIIESETPSVILRSQINIIMLAILITLFGIDFVVLARSGHTANNKTKTHFHLALLIIVTLVVASGTLSSHIQTGISI